MNEGNLLLLCENKINFAPTIHTQQVFFSAESAAGWPAGDDGKPAVGRRFPVGGCNYSSARHEITLNRN